MSAKLESGYTSSPLHFARFEFKYLLSSSLRMAIEKDLAFFLQPDPFVSDWQQRCYPVRSLYFDDQIYTAFYDKVDGLHTRSKFRLRTYRFTANESAPLFLENKGRHNNLVFKHRAPVLSKLNHTQHVSGDALIQTIISQLEHCPVRDSFEYEWLRKSLKPVALIDYLRHPYISQFDPDFRITFDEQLVVTRSSQLFPDASQTTAKQILPGYTILEVKFRHHMPSWFHRIIQAYELQRVSISKICQGMEVLGLASDFN